MDAAGQSLEQSCMTKTRGWACGVALALHGVDSPRRHAPPRRSSFARTITSASSATRWPSGCSTTAGSRRCCTRAFRSTSSSSAISASAATRSPTRLRSKNFGTPDEWLSGRARRSAATRRTGSPATNTKADVDLRVLRLQRVVRRRGRARRVHAAARATGSRTRWRSATTARPRRASCCSRRSRTRTSAIPDLPDGQENNERLALYTRAMAEVAKAHGVIFVDLFAPSRQLYAPSKAPLTMNGVHLNAEGNRRIAEVIDRALFGAPPSTRSRT